MTLNPQLQTAILPMGFVGLVLRRLLPGSCRCYKDSSEVLALHGSGCSGQPIVCPSLNPSDVLEDNCTGLLAGQLLGPDQTCRFRVEDVWLLVFIWRVH